MKMLKIIILMFGVITLGYANENKVSSSVKFKANCVRTKIFVGKCPKDLKKCYQLCGVYGKDREKIGQNLWVPKN